ncbi:hypothetical protein [Cellvibrio sp. UBA7661]|uniref:hypothetical protein n=1 Tax=Cellvibrio sp. UBA7661 TaxID=1946311 RepID=UPI002F355C00
MNKSVFLIPLLLIGCGDGGDKKNDPPKDDGYTNTSFSLENVTSLTAGKVYATELMESDKTGFADLYIKNQQETVVNGVLVTPQYRHFVVKESRFGSSTMAAPTWESTSYFDTATKNVISFQLSVTRSGMGPRIICTSLSPYHLPNQVKLGDKDSMPGFSCDNNIAFSAGSWRTEKADKGNLNFIVRTQTLDPEANIIDETTTYTIDPQGNILSVQINNLKSFTD